MNSIYTVLFFYGNFLLVAVLYCCLYRMRKLIGFQSGKNIAMLISGTVGTLFGSMELWVGSQVCWLLQLLWMQHYVA